MIVFRADDLDEALLAQPARMTVQRVGKDRVELATVSALECGIWTVHGKLRKSLSSTA